MKQRWELVPLLVFLVLFLLICSACSTCQKNYEKAQHLFSRGEYDEAMDTFDALGNYEQASLYATYIRTMMMGENGKYDLAIAGFKTLGEFSDSRLQTIYYTARFAEAEQRYEDAAESYRMIAAFRDSLNRLEKIPALIWQREYDAGIAPFLALETGNLQDLTEDELNAMVNVCNKTINFLSNPTYAVENDENNVACIALLARITAEKDARLNAQAMVLYHQANAVNLNTAPIEDLEQANVDCQEALLLLECAAAPDPALYRKLQDLMTAVMFQSNLKKTNWFCVDYSKEEIHWVTADGKIQRVSEEGLCSFSETVCIHETVGGLVLTTADGSVTKLSGYTQGYGWNIPSGFLVVEINEKRGLIRTDGTIIIPAEYDDISYCGAQDGRHYFSVESNGYCALADDQGNILSNAIWSGMSELSDGLIRVKRGNYYGFINCQGEEVIPCVWQNVEDFHDGRAMVEKGEYTGYIDKNGELVIPTVWSIPSDFSEGLASVYGYKNNLIDGFQYIDREGNIVIPHSDILQSGGDFFDGVADVSDYDAKKVTLINKRGNMICAPCDAVQNYFLDGYVRIKMDGKWGMLNPYQQTLIPIEMDYIEVIPYYSDDADEQQFMVVVRKEGKSGIYNAETNTISYFDGIMSYSMDYITGSYVADLFVEEQLICIAKDGLYGCIDFQGEVIIPFEWEWAEPIKNGFALVRRDGIFHLLDISGQIIW